MIPSGFVGRLFFLVLSGISVLIWGGVARRRPRPFMALWKDRNCGCPFNHLPRNLRMNLLFVRNILPYDALNR